MIRREFLKLVLAASVMPRLEEMPIAIASGGITNAQLCDIIKTTLKDLPDIDFDVMHSHPRDYDIAKMWGKR